jgi:CDGSH iron-sulfur domain-containing protein 3
VLCQADASLAVTGDFELVDAKGAVAARGNVAWLCRCGGSGNKPFCDGTHKKIGFKSG